MANLEDGNIEITENQYFSKTKIFGIGLDYSGLQSLTSALQILGYNVSYSPLDIIDFKKFSYGDYHLPLLADCDGVTGEFLSPFYAQLSQIYPNSKFIFTLQDKHAWLEIVEKKWFSQSEIFNSALVDVHVEWQRFVRAALYGVWSFNSERLAYIYDNYYTSVTEFFRHRPNSLLILDLTTGNPWTKLCKFLDCSVPDQNFPIVNNC